MQICKPSEDKHCYKKIYIYGEIKNTKSTHELPHKESVRECKHIYHTKGEENGLGLQLMHHRERERQYLMQS